MNKISQAEYLETPFLPPPLPPPFPPSTSSSSSRVKTHSAASSRLLSFRMPAPSPPRPPPGLPLPPRGGNTRRLSPIDSNAESAVDGLADNPICQCTASLKHLWVPPPPLLGGHRLGRRPRRRSRPRHRHRVVVMKVATTGKRDWL